MFLDIVRCKKRLCYCLIMFLLEMFCFREKKSEIIYIKMLTIVIPKCCNGKRGLISYLGFAILANFSSTGR